MASRCEKCGRYMPGHGPRAAFKCNCAPARLVRAYQLPDDTPSWRCSKCDTSHYDVETECECTPGVQAGEMLCVSTRVAPDECECPDCRAYRNRMAAKDRERADRVRNARVCPECWGPAVRWIPCPACGTADPGGTAEVTVAGDITSALLGSSLTVAMHGLPVK